jgi:polyhydroxybutyrate depolymerase
VACGDATPLPAADAGLLPDVGADAAPDALEPPALPPTFADVVLGDTAPPPPPAPDDGADPRPPWLWPGEDRPVAAFYPPAPPADGERPPLLILLHGFGASGAIQDAYLGVSREATARGWVVLTPDGTRNGAGQRFWNARPSWCCDFERSGVDDLGYLTNLIDHATSRLGTDPRRVALIGHSNGGYMAHRMACAAADRIAAFASLAGGLPLAAADCAPARPVPALHIHGTLDAVVLYLGQPGVYVGAEAVVSRWAGYNRCAGPALVASGQRRDHEATLPFAETVALAAEACEAPAELWRITGGAHVPAFRPGFMPAVLAWLEAASASDQGAGGPR